MGVHGLDEAHKHPEGGSGDTLLVVEEENAADDHLQQLVRDIRTSLAVADTWDLDDSAAPHQSYSRRTGLSCLAISLPSRRGTYFHKRCRMMASRAAHRGDHGARGGGRNLF